MPATHMTLGQLEQDDAHEQQYRHGKTLSQDGASETQLNERVISHCRAKVSKVA